MNNNIDLKAFCADELYPIKDARQPFNYGGKTYATNGHIAICVDEISGYEVIAHAGIINCLSRIFCDGAVFDIEDTDRDMPTRTSCNTCQSTGMVSFKECEECRGNGCIKFENDFNSYSVDCESCDGGGEIVTKGESSFCRACYGTCLTYDSNAKVYFESLPIAPAYFSLVKKLNPVAARVDINESYVAFRGDGFQAVIMGLREWQLG